MPSRQESFLATLARVVVLFPFPVLALAVYMGLRSSAIMDVPEGEVPGPALWAPAYTGWYDYLLVASVVLGMVTGSIRVTRSTLILLYCLMLAVLVSFFGGYALGGEFMADAAVHCVRIACGFLLADTIARRLDVEAVEVLIISLFLILSGTAVLVYALNFGSYNRIYASAMTAASFGQMAAVAMFLGLLRRRYVLFAIAAVFLVLTFSRTSAIVLAVLLGVYFFHCPQLPFKTKAWQLAAVCVFAGAVVVALMTFERPQFEGILSRISDPEEVSTLNGRVRIWSYAVDVLRDSRIPLTGVGFNAAPSLLAGNNAVAYTDDNGETQYPVHFHSILIEYGFGLGVSSLLLVGWLAMRLTQTFRRAVYPSFFLFALFALTQSVDFTFYRPKEVVMWSLLLGLAESQWLLERSRTAPRPRRSSSARRSVRHHPQLTA